MSAVQYAEMLEDVNQAFKKKDGLQFRYRGSHKKCLRQMARTLVEIIPIGRTGTETYTLLVGSVQNHAEVKSI
jgi:hypothetical protein